MKFLITRDNNNRLWNSDRHTGTDKVDVILECEGQVTRLKRSVLKSK